MARLIASVHLLSVRVLSYGLATVILLAMPVVHAQTEEYKNSSTLRGTVRDSQGRPVSAAMVRLQANDATQPLTTHSDSQGGYSFTTVRTGVYALRAQMNGFADALIPSLFLEPRETKHVDLTLGAANATAGKFPASQAPEFFETPQFTVAGVTDTTSLGGHGSDTVVRTRESLARETASLGKTPARSAPDTPSAAEKVLPENLERSRDEALALLAHHDTAEAHHLLAGIQEKLGDSLDAVHEYQRAAEMDPRETYLFDWGSELLLHHAPEPALEVFSQGNRLFPTSIRMLIGIGAAWFARGSYDQAVLRICQASDLQPDDSVPYLFLGRMLSAVNTPSTELVDKLHRFATLQPQDAEANYYYAVALWKSRKNPQDAADVKQVESLLDHAIQLDSKFAAAYLQRGVLRAERRDSPAAISDYQQAIQSDPHLEEAHYRLAQAYRQAGEADKAKEELAIYDKTAKESAEQADRDRHEIRQFVYTLRDATTPQIP